MARNLYEKLMTRYEASPDDPMAKFSKAHPKNGVKDAKSTIARVKEALQRGMIFGNFLDTASGTPRMGCQNLLLINKLISEIYSSRG